MLFFIICILVPISTFSWNLSETILPITFERNTASGTAEVNKKCVKKVQTTSVSSECCINQGNSNSSSEFRTELHVNVLQEIFVKIISINCVHTQRLAYIINLLFYMPASNTVVTSVKEGK